MASVKSKHTAPELLVRKAAHKAGLRFRLHPPKLPGKPDLVFSKFRTAIFVHGCFWHQHPGCKRAALPKTRSDFWESKFATNRDRDRRSEAALGALGWRVLTIWECEAENPRLLADKLSQIISGADPSNISGGKRGPRPQRPAR